MIATVFRVMLLGLVRDRGALVLAFVLPPLMFLVFAEVFSGAGDEDLKLRVAVLDESGDPAGQRLRLALLALDGVEASDRNIESGTQEMLINALLFFGTLVAMEGVAWIGHRYVMHGWGWGWGWHRSHHEPRTGLFEKNDLFAVVGAAVSIVLIYAGSVNHGPSWWIGWGMTAYGFCYFVFHDGLVHRRWPFKWQPKGGYLKRLIQAHKLHHAVHTREGCISFGFLYAPPLDKLKAEFRRIHSASWQLSVRERE